MTQHENGSRLDLIEAIMLDLATASIRYDNAISRHDEEFSRINATLERITEQQAATAAGQELNRQAIANLTAGLLKFRNLVADYIQGRSQH